MSGRFKIITALPNGTMNNCCAWTGMGEDGVNEFLDLDWSNDLETPLGHLVAHTAIVEEWGREIGMLSAKDSKGLRTRVRNLEKELAKEKARADDAEALVSLLRRADKVANSK